MQNIQEGWHTDLWAPDVLNVGPTTLHIKVTYRMYEFVKQRSLLRSGMQWYCRLHLSGRTSWGLWWSMPSVLHHTQTSPGLHSLQLKKVHHKTSSIVVQCFFFFCLRIFVVVLYFTFLMPISGCGKWQVLDIC